MRLRGFTLVELIVVISIVALLAALLMPVLHSAREQAKSGICQTHIKQLLLEFEQYCQSENGLLPYSLDYARLPAPRGGFAGDFTLDPPAWWWFDHLEATNHSSLRESEIITCPSKRLDESSLARNLLCGNYGVNRSVCRSGNDLDPYRQAFSGPPLFAGDIRHPGATFLIVDSGYAVVCWWHAANEPPVRLGGGIMDTAYIPGLEINKDRELRPEQIHDAISGRHPGKTVNLGFADGHVGRKKADDLLVRKIDDDTYTNLKPLWEPK